jgi:hypothetical protein
MNQWTEHSALKSLNGNVYAYNKQLSGHGGLHGLRACSAYDYLCDYCGYQHGDMVVETNLKDKLDR